MANQHRSWCVEQGDRQIRFASDAAAHLFADTANAGDWVSRMQPTWRVVIGLEAGIKAFPHSHERVRGVVVPPESPSICFSSRGYVKLHINPWEVRQDIPAKMTALGDQACRRILDALRLDQTIDLDEGRRHALEYLPGNCRGLDPRVSYALHNLTRFSKLDDLASEVGLSPPRLRALVQTTVGIPLARLRQWERLRMAFMSLDRGLTAAANQGGFVDQAHFTRVTRRLLGITPGSVFRTQPQAV